MAVRKLSSFRARALPSADEKLLQVEGLRQQPACRIDPVGSDLGERRDDENVPNQLGLRLLDVIENSETVNTRHHQIEHDQVILGTGRELLDCFDSVGRDFGHVAVRLQNLCDQTSN